MWDGSETHNVSKWTQVRGVHQKLFKNFQREAIGDELILVRENIKRRDRGKHPTLDRNERPSKELLPRESETSLSA